MLRWRLLLGALLIAALAGLVWLDHLAGIRGAWLFLPAAILTVLATGEVLHLFSQGGLRPVPWVVYGGNLLLLAANWLPFLWSHGERANPAVAALGWPMAALTVGMLLLLAAEMRRFERPGGVNANLAAGVFALVYVGVLFGFLVQLRMAWGLRALVSMVIVVKTGDTGAYFVGRLVGRHKLTPVLSPGKTIEGAAAQLIAGAAACWATLTLAPLAMTALGPAEPWWRAAMYGLILGAAGMFGDLAESLLKRDAGCKDSSRWLPGYGGVLDLLDSLLTAAPVAWVCWACGLVGG